jgi:hypothetical protein
LSNHADSFKKVANPSSPIPGATDIAVVTKMTNHTPDVVDRIKFAFEAFYEEDLRFAVVRDSENRLRNVLAIEIVDVGLGTFALPSSLELEICGMGGRGGRSQQSHGCSCYELCHFTSSVFQASRAVVAKGHPDVRADP